VSIHRFFDLMLGLIILVGCSPQVGSQPITIPVNPDAFVELTPDLKVRHIQEGAFVFTHAFPWDANSLVVVEGSHLVMVDTPYTPQATRDMLDWLEDQLGPKDVVAINTHFHIDNLGGNASLIELRIPVYGSELTAQLLSERGDAVLAKTVEWMQANEDPRYAEAFASFPLVPPTKTFNLNDGLVLNFGDENVQVFFPGPTHAPDNVVVYFPARKLLFGGCMIIGLEAVGNTTDSNLEAWPESIRSLDQFDFDILVPGHGKRLDPGLMMHTTQLLGE